MEKYIVLLWEGYSVAGLLWDEYCGAMEGIKIGMGGYRNLVRPVVESAL